jgi:hypothetical protein
MFLTDHKEKAPMSRLSAQSRRSRAANRPAAFAPLAIDSFQFPRQKGWKILLFERLALFL